MLNDVQEMLGHWLRDPSLADVQRLDEAGSFSGARLWRVEYRERAYVLRRWPREASPGRTATIHQVQRALASCRLPIPAPIGALATGESLVPISGSWWELAPWMPGTADYWLDPRPEKLSAALSMLARVHVAASQLRMPNEKLYPPVGVAPGLRLREDRLHSLLRVEFQNLRHAVERARHPAERQLIDEALQLIERTLPAQIDESLRWRDRKLPLHICLRDVWHDHVLYMDDCVTGIIDFGAAAFDAPAGDVARLLGSMVGDDADGWRIGMEAYQSVRSLSDAERDAVHFFDTSGTVLSAGNWIVWLWPKPNAERPPIRHRAAAIARLGRLVLRLRVLAARGS